jgi:hypothetical protein
MKMSAIEIKVLAMERKHVRPVKAIVGDNVSEQTNVFKYLGRNRPISMYKKN